MDGGGHLERRSRLSIRVVQGRRKASGQGGLGVTLGNQGYLGQGCARKHEDQRAERVGLARRSRCDGRRSPQRDSVTPLLFWVGHQPCHEPILTRLHCSEMI